MNRPIVVAALLSSFIACAAAQSAAAPAASGAASAAVVEAPRAGDSLVGQSLAAAGKTELFQFFHFAKSGDRPDPAHAGMRLVTYDTTGPFKGRVTLLASTRVDDDTVRVAGLMLQREFVDGPTTASLARELAKSFLERAPTASTPEVAALRAILWPACGSAPLAGAASAADVAAERAKACAGADASPAYQAFLGKQPKWKGAGQGGYVMLQNATLNNTPLLFVEMGAE